jgi:multidrug resistance protein, MATE family
MSAPPAPSPVATGAAPLIWPAILREVPGLISLAVPLVIGLAAATLIGVTDTIMIAPLGRDALAAAALTSSVIVIFYASVYGGVSSIGIAVANAHGARDGRAIAAITRAGLRLGLVWGLGSSALFGLLFLGLPLLGQPPEVLAILPAYWFTMGALLAPYAMLLVFKQLFEAIDRPWLGTAFSFVGVAVNIPLNYVLIFGPGPLPALGLLGAGIASLVSEIVALLAAWAFWALRGSTRRLRVRARTRRDAATASGLAREGAPLGLMYAAEAGSMAVAGLMLGWFGAVALAANQVANSVGGLLYMIPLGMAGAVAIRIGQADGAGDSGRLRAIAFAAMGVVTLWMVGSMLLLALGGRAIAAAITQDAAVVTLAAAIFVVVALMQVADGLQSTALGALRGLHDTTWPSGVSLVSYWLLSLPLGWVLAFPLGFGPVGLWAGFAAGLLVAAVALPLRFLALTSKPRAPPAPG